MKGLCFYFKCCYNFNIYILFPYFRGVSSSSSGKVFREAFSRIGEIRSFCSEKVPVLALSATVEIDFTPIITAACSLSKHIKFIYSCSDRKNIRLSIVKVDSKNVSCFNWLFKLLLELGENCPKVLIYCRSQHLTAWLFTQFLHVMKHDLYKDKIKKSSHLLVGMYHADSPQYDKDKCMTSLTSQYLLPRVVIATSAIGCGTNTKNLCYVCHFGPSYSLIDYCQQIGRAGRDGQYANAVLYYPESTRNVDKEMKQYTTSPTQCLRTTLFSPFNECTELVTPLEPGHMCCSVCTKTCQCEDVHKFDHEDEILFGQNEPEIAIREVTPEDKQALD